MRFVGKRMAAAAVVPMFLLVSACGSDDKKDDKPATAGNAAATAGASSDAAKPSDKPADKPTDKSADKPSTKALTAEQLVAAMVATKDLPGYTVTPGEAEDPGAEEPSEEKADKAECQPILNVITADKEHWPTAAASASVNKNGAGPGQVMMFAVAQFDGDKADSLVSSARSSLAKCTAFSGTDSDGTKTEYAVTPGKASPVAKDGKAFSFGDDSLVFAFGTDGDQPTNVHLVRSGSAVIYVMSMDITTAGPAPTVPEEMIRAQYDKLLKAQKP
jgi:hypothetical protein